MRLIIFQDPSLFNSEEPNINEDSGFQISILENQNQGSFTTSSNQNDISIENNYPDNNCSYDSLEEGEIRDDPIINDVSNQNEVAENEAEKQKVSVIFNDFNYTVYELYQVQLIFVFRKHRPREKSKNKDSKKWSSTQRLR